MCITLKKGQHIENHTGKIICTQNSTCVQSEGIGVTEDNLWNTSQGILN